MRKTTNFNRMKRSDCYYMGIEWGTPIGSVQVLDTKDPFKFDLVINDEYVLFNETDSTIVTFVNSLIKEETKQISYDYAGKTGYDYAKATLSHTTKCNWHLNGNVYKENQEVTPLIMGMIVDGIIEKTVLIGNVEHIYLISE